MAQLVEQLIRNQQVTGSSPVTSSIEKQYPIGCCFFVLLCYYIIIGNKSQYTMRKRSDYAKKKKDIFSSYILIFHALYCIIGTPMQI